MKLTLAGWLVLALTALVLLSLAVPAMARSGRHAQLVECRGNLATLFKAQADPAAAMEKVPLGSAYWVRLAPRVAPGALRCPLVPKGIGRPTDYLGPKDDLSTAKPDDPLGCDDEPNHDPRGRMGGSVLYRTGEVKTLHPTDSETTDPWRYAAKTKCAY